MARTTWILLFLVALAVRSITWPSVFTPDGVMPWEPDAYYHLRRIWQAVDSFPSLPSHDPWLAFPHGGKAIWTPVLDWTLAAIAWPFATDRESVEHIVVWAPPLLGAATALATLWLARRHFGREVALISAGLVCLLPGHFWFSQLGYVDHHAAVALLSVWLLGTTMSSLEDVPTGPSLGRRGLRRGAGLGLAMAASLAAWPGCLLHVGIVEVALVASLVATSCRASAVARAYRFAWAHLVAAALVLPLALGADSERWGVFSPLVLSNFQPLALVSGAVFFLALAEVWRRYAPPASAIDRALWVLLVGGLLAGSLIQILSPLESGLGDAFAWFARTEAFQSSVGESTPLFWGERGFDRSLPEALFSRFVYTVPVLCLAFGLSLRAGRGRRAPAAAFLIWTLGLFLATLVQHRFMNSFSPAYAMLLAWAGVESWRALRRRLQAHPGRRAATLVLAAALTWLCVQPTVGFYRPYVRNLGRFLQEQPPIPYGWSRGQQALLDVARWLRGNSPPLEAHAMGAYSILSSWSHGHVLRYVSRRPVVQDNFGDDVNEHGFELSEEYFASEDEARALEIAEALRVRYVLVDRQGSGHSRGYGPRSMWNRLFHPRVVAGPRQPSARWSESSPRPPGRHRLVYESPPPWGRPRAAPQLLLYEIVPGVRVVGSAQPGAVVTARIELRTIRQRVMDLEFETRADSSGRYELVLPYPNDEFSPAIEAAPFYRLHAGAVSARLRVPGDAPRQSGALRGPDLRQGAG